MAPSQELSDLLEAWRNTCFRPNEMTLTEAVHSLSSESPLIEARPGQNPSRWILFDTRNDKVAVLVHAGLWAWCSNLKTGNYVPRGQKAPEGLPDSRMQDEVSYKCEISYTLETTVDDSIFSLLKALEVHVSSFENFNRSGKPRRPWQDGTERHKFLMSSKIFAKKTPFNTNQGTPLNTPYELHPWIRKALDNQESPVYVANPESPQYLERQGEVLTDLFNSDEPQFQRGDIVWFSFKLGFYVNKEHWAPEIIPIAFVRVAVSPDPPIINSDYSSYPTVDDAYAALKAGAIAVPIIKRNPTINISSTTRSSVKHKLESNSGSDTCDSDDMPLDREESIPQSRDTSRQPSPPPSSTKRKPRQRVRY